MNIAELLQAENKGMVVAPAGYGKTHLIAESVVNFGKSRELILTHTHAGVGAIKAKIAFLKPSRRNFHVETIDGFILRYVLSYPKTSQWIGSVDDLNWEKVREGGIRLFKEKFIKNVVMNSYAGLYVDEYQDCGVDQHEIILELATVLPTRVLGDPLQGIFDFGSNTIVDWDKDVKDVFKEVAVLDKPWRWERINNKDLGEWLSSVRGSLLNKKPISLTQLPSCVKFIRGSTPQQKVNACCSILSRIGTGESVAVIGMADKVHPMHYVASRLKGRYGILEPIDSKDMKAFIGRFKSTCAYEKAMAALDFGCCCFSGISKTLLKPEYGALQKKACPKQRQSFSVFVSLKELLDKNDLGSLITLIESLRGINKSHLYRKELFFETLKVLREGLRTGNDLQDILVIVRENTRRVGRKIYSRIIARTVLIKGLEFDHAIILDAHLFDEKNLYVALTRASKTVTIVSGSDCLLQNRGNN